MSRHSGWKARKQNPPHKRSSSSGPPVSQTLHMLSQLLSGISSDMLGGVVGWGKWGAGKTSSICSEAPSCPKKTFSLARRESGCNSHQKTVQIVAAFAPNSCTATMIRRWLCSLKELRSNVGCVAGMEFMPTAGRKKHWPTGGRWTTTPDFKAAIDARCAMPIPPRFKRRAKLLNH